MHTKRSASVMGMLTILGCTGSFLLSEQSADARPLKAETSAYGKFIVKSKGDECTLQFKHASGRVTELFQTDGCDPTGLAPLEGIEKVGATLFPLKSVSGDEFHLFAIPTARGGNACDGYDFFGVVVYEDAAWATTTAFGGCSDLSEARLVESGKATLVATVAPTAHAEGAVYSLKLGKLDKRTVAKVKREVKETRQITVVGLLGEGGHFSNYLPVIDLPKDDQLIIDKPGRCDLTRLGNRKVEMKAEKKLYKDGSAEVTCLSISPAK